MAITFHNIDQIPLGSALVNGSAVSSSNGGGFSTTDTLKVGILNDIAFIAGASAGATVVMTFTGLDLPASYSVDVALSVPGTATISNKTYTGFTVTLAPTVSTLTLAAGTMDVRVFA